MEGSVDMNLNDDDWDFDTPPTEEWYACMKGLRQWFGDMNENI